MTIITRARGVSLLAAAAAVSCWLAAPLAGQEEPNDQFILFTSDRAFPNPAGVCANCEDIYVMPPVGELPGVPTAIRLTFGSGVVPESYSSGGADWSRTKRVIAFQSNRPTDPIRLLERVPQIYVMNPDGTGQRLLVSLPRGAAFPHFSHSGNQLCFQSQTTSPGTGPRRDIYTVHVDGTGLINLTSEAAPGQLGTAGDNLRCDWSPKGDAIAFTSNRHDPDDSPDAQNQEIYLINADGSGVPERLTYESGSDANPAWSPKGDKIAFESNRSGRPEIWVMNADGSYPVRLTNFDSYTQPRTRSISATKPTWSPKGDRIAFHRRVSEVEGGAGHLQVYTMNSDGSDVRPITFTEDPGFSGFPSWGKWGTDF
jgi:TolB protein